MAEGFGRNEILSLIAGGALAVPALVGALALLLVIGQAPAITRRVEGMSMPLPWRKPAAAAHGQPHAAPTPMAMPHRAHGASAVHHPALQHASLLSNRPTNPPGGEVASRADEGASRHTGHLASPLPHRVAGKGALPHTHPPRAEKNALAAMRVGHDELRNLVSYTDPTTDASDRSSTGLHCYVLQPANGAPTLRLRVRWVDRRHAERLGLEGLYFHVDGRKYAIDNPPYGLLDVQGDISVTAEHAWEWYDTQADRKQRAMLRVIAAAKTAVIRYDGTHGQAKHVVTPAEKAAIARVLAAYDALSSGA